MCDSHLITQLHKKIENCNWKSVLFLSKEILTQDPCNFDALFAKSMALFCTAKYSELEEWMKTLPNDVNKNYQLVEIRCKALQIQKSYNQIVALLGGNTLNQLIPPLIEINEVENNPRLNNIRQNALLNLSQAEVFPLDFLNIKASSFNDPLSPESISKSIKNAMMQHKPDLVQKYTNICDKTSQTDDLLITACGCYKYLMNEKIQGRAFVLKATEINPDCEIAWLALIFILTETSEWEQGYTFINKVSRRFPNSDSVSLFAISLYLKSNSVQLAWPWINKKVINDPFYQHELAVAFYIEGDIYKAAQKFTEIIEMKNIPDDIIGSSLINLGHCLRRLGKFQEAINSYTKAIGKNIETPNTLCSIGFTYLLMGQTNEAITWFNSCLSIDNVNPFATRMLDTIFMNLSVLSE